MSDVTIQYLYHCTTLANLRLIIESGQLLNTCSRRLHLNTEIRRAKGEGSNCRTFTNAKVSLHDPLYWKTFDEANGVYFRVGTNPLDYHTPLLSSGSIVLVFSANILKDPYYTWNINTTENNGFYLADPGIEAISPFSGDQGVTYDSSNIDDYDGTHVTNHEVLIWENVSLEYLDHILVTSPEEIRSITDLPIFVLQT